MKRNEERDRNNGTRSTYEREMEAKLIVFA